MKTVFVVGARGIPDIEGGVEKSAERLFPRLAAMGWQVTLAGLSQHLKAPEYSGVKLWPAPAVRFLKTDKLVYYVSALFHAIRSRPDIVHLAGLGAAVLLFAYKCLGCKIVVRYGSADYLNSKWGVLGKLGFRFAEYQLRFADAVVAVTPALAKRLKAKNIIANVRVIPNALDCEKDYETVGEILTGNSYILAVGRITAQKNYHRLIEGFQIFARSNPGIKLVIAGSKEDHDYLRLLEPRLGKSVILLDFIPRSRLRAFFCGASVYINSSLHEGHSNAVLEAIGFGCPVLISDIPENRDFGLDGKHYFDPDDPNKIAAALSRAYSRQDQFRVPQEAFWTWDEVAGRTTTVYESLFAEDKASLEAASERA